MRIPEYSELIDNDTMAFFPFNGNLTDMCGNYELKVSNGSSYKGEYVYSNELKKKCIKFF